MYPNHMKPKHHFLIHYARIMKAIGPLPQCFFVKMSRPRTRSVAALEELYKHGDVEEEESASDNASDTDDAVDEVAESSHNSETDAESYTEKINSKGRNAQVSYTPAPKGDAMYTRSPVESWAILFSIEILEIILKHTNEQINRRIGELERRQMVIDTSLLKVTDIVELKAVFGLLYCAGAHKLIKCKTMNWWSVHSMPLFKATMSRNRFTFLFDCLRFDDKNTRNERKPIDRFTHIREIWDLFIERCKNNYEPCKNITIDEQLLSFRGRCSFKMYIPSKRDKYGLKIASMNDADTHYMINAIPYFGTVTERVENEPIPTYYV
ncbi:piggyBac transposable element-derived protein 4-like [Leptopilina boulardi]|uniref:piggyBac transposable element-derived protein 4-like n=1 Tax=Leptopilina boulardi TaxID=63433 RepID=UPI0021F5DEBD|nr:piggyBac transposable element-derived protein 4-like [Leptopilina boulardi]